MYRKEFKVVLVFIRATFGKCKIFCKFNLKLYFCQHEAKCKVQPVVVTVYFKIYTKMNPEKLRTLRMQKGYSQSYVAMRLGISQQSYSKMERGVSAIPLSRLGAIAQILEVEWSQLILEENKEMTELTQRVTALESELATIKSMLDDAPFR